MWYIVRCEVSENCKQRERERDVFSGSSSVEVVVCEKCTGCDNDPSYWRSSFSHVTWWIFCIVCHSFLIISAISFPQTYYNEHQRKECQVLVCWSCTSAERNLLQFTRMTGMTREISWMNSSYVLCKLMRYSRVIVDSQFRFLHTISFKFCVRVKCLITDSTESCIGEHWWR